MINIAALATVTNRKCIGRKVSLAPPLPPTISYQRVPGEGSGLGFPSDGATAEQCVEVKIVLPLFSRV